MSMLDTIRETLETFGDTHYGRADVETTETWDYFVFRRVNLKKKGSGGTDYNRYYQVAIVRENYIPENYEFEIIKAICTATRMRLADVDVLYDYTFKGATDLIVEVALITFTEHIKGCVINGE